MSKSQTILVTGATSGIGRDAVFHLLAAGHRVVATGRNQAALDEIVREVGSDRLLALRLDVTRSESIEAAVRAVDAWTGGRGLDALVNNAGYGALGPSVEASDDELRGMYETNVFGLMAMIRAFSPKMMSRRDGTIVNVSSIGGRFTLPFFGAYNSTKYAVESLSDALRRELAPFGVRVVLVEPGPIKTAFADRSVRDIAAYGTDASPYREAIRRAEALKEKFDAQAYPPVVISKAIRRAIEARRPPARIVAPLSSAVLVFAMTWLPTPVVDFVLSRVAGLTRRGLGLGPAAPAGALTASSVG